MKNIFLFTFLSIYAYGCNTRASGSQSITDSINKERFIDSFKKAKEKEFASELLNAAIDTIGLSRAPVKITTAKLIREEYSSFRSVYLSWKNVSSKKISAIRFKWYGVNAFGEPADMGSSMIDGIGGGFNDQSLPPGKTDDGTWSILSKDGKKIIVAWPYEVAFEDGTKWKCGKE